MSLSVVIPVYNVEQYLEECLDSVLQEQSVDLAEVICVNDGSPDGSSEILADYKKKYPDLIVIDQENAGLSAARNTGLADATSEYVYFLDSDDYLLPGALDQALDFAIKHQTDIAGFNAIKSTQVLYYKEQSEVAGVHSGTEYYPEYYRKNRFFPPSAIWLYIYKRSFLLENKLWFKKGYVHEDEEFTPRAFCLAERVATRDFPLLLHRVMREGAITTTLNEKNLSDLVGNMCGVYEFFKSQNVEEELFYHKLFEVYFSTAKKISAGYGPEKRSFFSKDDFERMKDCAMSWEWFAHYWLFRYSLPVFRWYSSQNGPVYLKKIMNQLFKRYYKIYVQS